MRVLSALQCGSGMPVREKGKIEMKWIKAIGHYLAQGHGILDTVIKVIMFLRDYDMYKTLTLDEMVVEPSLLDNTPTTTIIPEFFYQSFWAAESIIKDKPKEHVDVASSVQLMTFLSCVIPVTFIEFRPPQLTLPNWTERPASILALPYADNSIQSLSCLSVAEHIGLGRYGDDHDENGTRKACEELVRVLAPGGNLYFSLPIGSEPVTCYNAHRIHTVNQIRQYMTGLTLVELSGITEDGRYIRNIEPRELEKKTIHHAGLATGLFKFTKRGQ